MFLPRFLRHQSPITNHQSPKGGFSIIEVLIAAFVLGVVTVAITGLAVLITKAAIESERKNVATALGTDLLEQTFTWILDNFAYSDESPAGKVHKLFTYTRNNQAYTVEGKLTNRNFPEDGTDDPRDAVQVTYTISWESNLVTSFPFNLLPSALAVGDGGSNTTSVTITTGLHFTTTDGTGLIPPNDPPPLPGLGGEGGGEEEADPPGPACANDAECPQGDLCIDGQCQPGWCQLLQGGLFLGAATNGVLNIPTAEAQGLGGNGSVFEQCVVNPVICNDLDDNDQIQGADMLDPQCAEAANNANDGQDNNGNGVPDDAGEFALFVDLGPCVVIDEVACVGKVKRARRSAGAIPQCGVPGAAFCKLDPPFFADCTPTAAQCAASSCREKHSCDPWTGCIDVYPDDPEGGFGYGHYTELVAINTWNDPGPEEACHPKLPICSGGGLCQECTFINGDTENPDNIIEQGCRLVSALNPDRDCENTNGDFCGRCKQGDANFRHRCVACLPDENDVFDNNQDCAFGFKCGPNNTCKQCFENSHCAVGELCQNNTCIDAPECSDGIDNDDPEDILADDADPGCHTDGDANNPISYDPNFFDEGDATLPPAICSDTLDNDGDEKTDFGSDPGCLAPEDPSEVDMICSDGLDNDGDGTTDFGQDPGCSSQTDNSEHNTQAKCDNGIDDDLDGKIDFRQGGLGDPGCSSLTDDDETDAVVPQCSNGIDDDNQGDIDLADPDCGGNPNGSEFPFEQPPGPGAFLEKAIHLASSFSSALRTD